MLPLLIICVLTQPGRWTDAFVRSLARFGVVPSVVGQGERYAGGTWKQRKVFGALEPYRGKGCVFIYADAWDSIFVRPPADCLKRFTRLQTRLLFSGAATCHPSRVRAPEFPDRGRFRFISAGGFMGYVDAYCDFYEQVGMGGAPLNSSDQRVLIGAYLRDPTLFSIDHGCEVFQPIFGAPDAIALCHDEWVNLVTGTTPCILHGDSRSPLGHVAKWLEAQT